MKYETISKELETFLHIHDLEITHRESTHDIGWSVVPDREKIKEMSDNVKDFLTSFRLAQGKAQVLMQGSSETWFDRVGWRPASFSVKKDLIKHINSKVDLSTKRIQGYSYDG